VHEHEQLRQCLEKFSAQQQNTIAEMAAADCVLMSVWEDFIYRFVKGEVRQPDQILHAVVERVEQITDDLVSPAANDLFAESV